MTFEQMMRNYVDVIVCHGLNIQKGQVLLIAGEPTNRDLALRVAEAAYRRGARYVELALGDPRLSKIRFLNSRPEDLDFAPRYWRHRANELVDLECARLSICGDEEPDILSDIDPKLVNRSRLASYRAMKVLRTKGIDQGMIHWCVVGAATPAWGRQVFGKFYDAGVRLTDDKAAALLWEQIFKLVRADRQDPLRSWREHNDRLHSRGRRLNRLTIKELHFSGPGTDLIVGLSPKALFSGGTMKSSRGVEFEPNLPTEEVFSTPDWRMTTGHVRVTRPVYINGVLVTNLNIKFEDGAIVDFSADQGGETFETYINSDPGARRLGEVALVGIDSPVYQSGLVFKEILFDENAACHIAVGSAYKDCLQDGPKLSRKELKDIGYNDRSAHLDVMISSGEFNVEAETHTGRRVDVIRRGRWVNGF